MHEYFDAFVYVANWGTHQLMFRIPGNLLDAETARAYEHEEIAERRRQERSSRARFRDSGR